METTKTNENTKIEYYDIGYNDNIYKALYYIIHDILGYEIVKEKRGTDIASRNVTIGLERHSDEGTHTYRSYYVITYYIDKMHDYEQESTMMKLFVSRFRSALYYRINDIGINNFNFAGDALVDVNDRIQGLKLMYSFTSDH